MTLTRTALTGALLAALASLGTAHAATATASASISDLSFTLIDLDPTDGIAPSLTFNDPNGYGYSAYGWAYASQNDSAGVYVSDNKSYTAPYDTNAFVTPGSASATAGGSTATASSTLNGYSATATSTLTGDPASPSDYGNASATTYPNNYYYYNQGFTLGANTLLLVKGKYAVSASVDATGTTSDYAYAYAYMFGTFDSGNGIAQTAGLNKYVYAYGDVTSGYPLSDSKSGTFGFSFANYAPTAGTGSFYNSYTSVNTYVSTAAVPEADAWALALAGVGVAGLATTRRRRAQA
jgi:hypothetical protein